MSADLFTIGGKVSSAVKGRFAPSPTGRMHAGNIFAYLASWLIAKSQGGSIVLRIEDLDSQRSKPVYIDALRRDFERLGLYWDEGPYFQHDRHEAYLVAFESLVARGLVYDCYCTRADLHAASAPHKGEKPVYAGTCRTLDRAGAEEKRAQGRMPAARLVVPSQAFRFQDMIQGAYEQNLALECGDFVIRRGDGDFAYQLAVVVDDAAQGVTSVVRGVDLLDSTPQQRYLQELLGEGHPSYAHVPLLVADDGRRLSKRNKDAELDALLERFGDERALIGYIAGLTGIAESFEPASPQELLSSFDLQQWQQRMPSLHSIVWQ